MNKIAHCVIDDCMIVSRTTGDKKSDMGGTMERQAFDATHATRLPDLLQKFVSLKYCISPFPSSIS